MDDEKELTIEDDRRFALALDHTPKREDRQMSLVFEHLSRATIHCELAAESLSPVEGQVERWENVRALMFALKDMREAVRKYWEEAE